MPQNRHHHGTYILLYRQTHYTIGTGAVGLTVKDSGKASRAGSHRRDGAGVTQHFRGGHMRIRLVRRPGQHGTKDLVEQYGDRLICVRYRYDEVHKKRHKTIELIIETIDWTPKPTAETIVGVRVAYQEQEVRNAVRAAGGIWNPERRVWEIAYKHVLALGLSRRMVPLEE